MGTYKLYMWDLKTSVGKCWAESLEEANTKAEEMFGAGGFAMEDDADESAKKAS